MTIAVKLPADVGLVENVTVRTDAVEDDTVPTAPLLNVTVLLPAVVSKPEPLIVNVDVLAFSWNAELEMTTGMTVATWTAEPLLTPLVVVTAVRLPPARGLVVSVTVSEVAVAAETTPTALLLKTIVLREAVVSNPKPLIVIKDALAAKLDVFVVGKGVTVATCNAGPLLKLLVVTTAVKLLAEVGLMPKVTVNTVAVAAVTVPTAPLSNKTVLFPAVVLKPKPFIVSVAALADKFSVLLVTTGFTVAT